MYSKRIIWEPKLEVKLINLIKKEECLWKMSHKEFLSFRKRKKYFEEIARNLGSNFTVNNVQERWKTIKSTYRYNIRRIKNSKISGQTYEPSWHLWNFVQFLQDDDIVNDDCNISTPTLDKKNEFSMKKEVDKANLYTKSSKADKSQIRHKNASERSSECESLLKEAKSTLNILEADLRLDMRMHDKYDAFGIEVSNCLSILSPNDGEEAMKKIKDLINSYIRF